MHPQAPTFRLTAVLTTAALLLGSTAISAPSWAQAPSQPFQAAPDQNAVDPPARVGRLVTASGTVSYHAAGDSQWTPASMNFPVAAGGSFWTEPNAQAELELSSSRIRLAGGTEVDIGTLDAYGLQATLTQGEVLLRPRDLGNGETWSLITPRGTVTTSHGGRISVIAGDTESPSVVTVLEGEATVTGPGISQALAAGQAATMTGTDPLQITVGPAQPDAFALSQQPRDRPPLRAPASARPVPPPPGIATLPGGDDLQRYGAWNSDQEYGRVWYPQVERDWVPYREGHWAFVLPWGWTWVDDAPWGFAPFHYGRWIELRGRWGWTPEFDRDRYERYPVYAPALVTFLGIGIAVGIGAGPIGWVPLGPREPYRPWFQASPRYLGAVNGPQTIVVVNAINFRNQRAATMVPASVMTSSSPIRAFAQPIGAQALATARPLTGLHPVQPIATTAGVTPVAAQQLHLAPPAAGFARAPGPAVVPHTATAPVPVLRPPAPVLSTAAPIAPRPAMLNPVLTGPRPAVVTPAGVAPAGVAPAGSLPAGATQPRTGPALAAPPAVPRPASPSAAPPVVQRPTPPLATPAAVAQPHLPAAAPSVSLPAPQFAAPPPVQHPAPMVQRPTPAFAAPAPAPAPVQHSPPQQQFHAAPPPQPQFHAPAPPQPQPQFHAPPPPQPQPQPQFHAPPPPQPQPQVHAAPPPPQVHAAPPPPAPRPAPQAAPPPRQKRPGEP